MTFEASVTPFLHLGTIVGLALLLIAMAARTTDPESAKALAVFGTLLLLWAAAEHGVLAYFRPAWPVPTR